MTAAGDLSRPVITLGAYLGYYAAAVQVIPMLAGAIFVGESSYLRAPRGGSLRRSLFLFALFLLFLGELTALCALERGHDSALLWACTTAGLVYGLLVVLRRAVRALLLQDLGSVDPRRREGLARLSFVIALAALILAAVVLRPSY